MINHSSSQMVFSRETPISNTIQESLSKVALDVLNAFVHQLRLSSMPTADLHLVIKGSEWTSKMSSASIILNV
jgi:hypothetical protein